MHRRDRTILLAALSAGASFVAACEGTMSMDEADAATTPRDGSIPVDARTARDDASAIDGGTLPGDDASVGDPDAGSGLVPIFVAQGYAGRTTISCDDGRSWLANQSDDDAIRCFSDGFDCDHHPGRAKGVVYSHGYFVATYGWGPAGGVQRSRDGVDWTTTLEGTTFGGIAVSDMQVMLGARSARVSEDDGATWSEPISTMLEGYNVRRAGYAAHDGGRMLLVGDGGDVTLSSDGGATWWRPTTLPSSCGAGIQNDGGIGYVAGAIVIVGGDGSVCRSTDGGTTWTAHSIGSDISSSEVVQTASELLVWGGGELHRSSDGATWTSTALQPSGTSIGAVARSPDGTFVAVNSGWNRWYEQQRFYRSSDGVTWEQLASDRYVGSHPIFQIRFGLAEPSAACEATP
ncbi:MAG: glycoside hydrolase [Myxococcota bacterium]|nr:glycoside hydrolase [Myxococcota bacterium]